jgi:RNA polymerase sigma factor (sigma-70 family)
MMNDDMELLREYASRHSEPAFEVLAARHVGLVHSAALRQVRDPGLAEEITQTVFIILARKAGSLGPKTILPGWLYRTTRYVAAAALKVQRRRERREQEAHMLSTPNETQADAVWEQLAPLLDEAMAQLRDQDRDALVLRYFQNKSLRDVGAALGLDEYAAQKRVGRALEKLRVRFARHGLAITTTVITGAISANSVQAAPALLAKIATAVAITKGAAASGSTLTLIKGALKIMAWTKAKTAIVAGVVVLLAAGTTPIIIKEIRSSSSGPRTTPATEMIKGQLFGLAQLVDAGNTTPEAAWESRYWARSKGNYDAVIAATDPQGINVANDWMGDKATFRDRSKKEFTSSFKGFQILARKNLANDRVELKYQFTFQPAQETKIVVMIKVNGVWRCAQTRAYDASWDDGSQPEPQS